MRFLFRSLLGLFMFATAAGLLAAAGYTVHSAIQSRLAEGDRPRVAQERVFAARVLPVVSDTVTPVLETFGEVRALRSLELRVPVGGRVVELAPGFADGAELREGQLLLRLDDADARASRDVAQSDLSRAEAELRDARLATELAREDLEAAIEQQALRARALERQRDLLSRGVGTDAAVETAELALSSARQAVVSRRQALAQAEARTEQAETALVRQRITLAEAERRLADTELYAAFSGVLSDVTVAAGGIVTANERVGRIIDPDALEVAFRVSTAQYLRLIDGAGQLVVAPVEIALDVMGTEIVTAGQLTRVGAAVGEGQTGRLIYARIEAPRGFLPGDFVTLRVQEPALEAVALLPATAVDAAGTVLVLGPEERLEEAPVEMLRRQGDMVLVRAPAIEGREVVAERTPMLGAGIRVRPIRPQTEENGSAGAEAPAVTQMIELSAERRAQLIAFVEGNSRMPEEARNRILVQLSADRVPAQVVEQLENRMRGG
ncbi:efflux RND transporter periplasmic adaptor subunit [Alkalilacustris brevis]|uniref:efflux RND transporter periplasmic adaptor subunit n=1 Tax=Alkalilacustris brevis TaxID=2026338 RepID=UPI000E0D6FCC|nr:HlyD family efflux transporter periplasmic adaptor subunit [Alkalilacustris brevis]